MLRIQVWRRVLICLRNLHLGAQGMIFGWGLGQPRATGWGQNRPHIPELLADTAKGAQNRQGGHGTGSGICRSRRGSVTLITTYTVKRLSIAYTGIHTGIGNLIDH